MKKAILFSGGLDSTVLLYHLVHLYGKENVLAIGVDFGQEEVVADDQGNSFANNVIEKELMKRVTDKLGVKLEVIKLPYFEPVLDFMKERIANESDFYKKSTLSLFPARNYIMMYSAACVAEMHGADELYLGFAKTDYINGIGNPELSIEHLDKLNAISETASDFHVKFRAGFPIYVNDLGISYGNDLLSKAEEVKRGVELGVDFVNEVWTCLHPKYVDNKGYIQCGVCKSCIRNRAAFISAGVKDPFEYFHKEFILDPRTYAQMYMAGDDMSKFDIKDKDDK